MYINYTRTVFSVEESFLYCSPCHEQLHIHCDSDSYSLSKFAPTPPPPPPQLKDDVCSPAGTSIQAVRTMERAGFRGILMDAVHAATKRALELSRLENGEDKDVYVKR